MCRAWSTAFAALTPHAPLELALDTGTSDVLPTITIEDVDKAPVPDKNPDPTPQLPGAMPTGPAPDIPDWYKVGWKAFVHPPDEDQDVKEARMLHAFISEQYYGEWYHNAALIIFVRAPNSSFRCFGSSLVFRLSLLPIL